MNTKSIRATNGSTRKSCLSLMLALGLAFMLTLGTAQAFAGETKGGEHGGYGGGYSGPGPALVTVEQAKGMSDDARVALRGNIIQSLGGKHYVFKDATGTINVEVSDKRWQGQNIGPNDLVEIQGKVDKDWSTVEIEAKRLIKQ